jgi:hypothetical protein
MMVDVLSYEISYFLVGVLVEVCVSKYVGS